MMASLGRESIMGTAGSFTSWEITMRAFGSKELCMGRAKELVPLGMLRMASGIMTNIRCFDLFAINL